MFGSGGDEERRQLGGAVWTAGPMNLDTLNPYCGYRFVVFPCVCQGRFDIYEAVACIELTLVRSSKFY